MDGVGLAEEFRPPNARAAPPNSVADKKSRRGTPGAFWDNGFIQ